MPATTTAFLTGAAGLVGLLPLGGFWALQRGLDDFWYGQPWLVVVILAVNALTALSLTRVYRLVFLGTPQPKTRRAPEVPWTMAVPMISLSVVTLLVPVILNSLQLLPSWEFMNWSAAGLLLMSGITGCALGASLKLNYAWTRPIQAPLRFVQDFLAYDFYIDRLYRFTVVLLVSTISQFSAWFDRYIVDGFVNLVGLASILSGETLKYSASGRSQAYMLTIALVVGLLGALLTWSMW
jgi:NAD(P)H-quinone oxidoreductase subunit 5